MNYTLEEQTKIDSAILRAKSYPFELPTESYIFRINGIEKFDSVDLPNILHNRIPVLAYGSNGSAEQLKKKYADFKYSTIVPVIKAKLYDFDIVYSSHFSKYGAIPASLQYSKDTVANVFVTFLTQEQLEHMHITENVGLNYCFGRLFNIKLSIDHLFTLDSICSYFTLHDCLTVFGSNISLSSINVDNRKFPSMNETEVQTAICHLLDTDKNLDDFILENIENLGLKSDAINLEIKNKRIQILKKTALPLDYKYFEILKRKL